MGAAQAGGPGSLSGSAGFPQSIDLSSDAPSPSVVSGRTLNALPVFARLLSNSSSSSGASTNFSAVAEAARGWVAAQAEGLLFFSGQHPDLDWWDLEQDSVWEVAEAWLDVSEDRGQPSAARAAALQRAVGDVYVALLMLCPGQLSWVDNPTQMAADEQEMYSQYSVYTYHNRKWLVLSRLAEATGNALYQQLADRLLQLNAFTQVTGNGKASDTGGFHEAIADPWGARGGGPNFMGSVYLNELALDLALQLLLSGVRPTENYTQCVHA